MPISALPAAFDVTLALGALKPAHVLDAGLERCGKVLLADIGIPVDTRCRTVARPRLEAPGADSHKYTRGMVAVIGGAMPGARALAADAAMAGGAGYVVLAGDDPLGDGPDALVRREVRSAEDLTEFLGGDRSAPSCRPRPRPRSPRRGLAPAPRSPCPSPLVLDGDALHPARHRSLRAGSRPAPRRPGSRRMRASSTGCSASEGSKIDRTLAAAAEAGATIVYKGADTVIASPKGDVRVLAGASPWLSTAGTGDVLAGAARGADRCRAGREPHRPRPQSGSTPSAARLRGRRFIADDLVAHIPAAVSECL